MKNMNIQTSFVVLTMALFISTTTFAEETPVEKVQATTEKAVNSAKKIVRSAQDKGCEMVNGKAQCFGQKLKHKTQNVSEEITAKAKEIKNKVD